MLKISNVLLAVLCCGLSYSVYADIAVIANQDVPVSTLTRKDVERVFLGKMTVVENGARVYPVDQHSGSTTREKFYRDVLDMSETEVRQYWARVIFRGLGVAPVEEKDDNAVLNYVANHPYTIGYIDKSLVDDTVKVLYSSP